MALQQYKSFWQDSTLDLCSLGRRPNTLLQVTTMLRALTLSSALFAHGAHALPRPSWAVGPANTPPMGFNTVRFPDPTPLPSLAGR